MAEATEERERGTGLTFVIVVDVLLFVMACVPSVGLACLARLNDEDNIGVRT
jgi:hypothetical protein